MDFAEALKDEDRWTETENGADALNSTGNACLDFFSLIGALRNADENRVETLFAEAYKEDPLLATKIVFYGRDIREGLGERRVFRVLLRYMANHHPESLRNNLCLIGIYGRFDDLYSLVGTKLEEDMWQTMRRQFNQDIIDMGNDSDVSLLAKWIKTPDASSPKTRELGILTAKKLGYSVYDFKRQLRALRKYIDIVEKRMSANEWGEINYSNVPSHAMMNYRNAFSRHDGDRFSSYINDVTSGKDKINSSILYPYNIVQKIMHGEDDEILEAQWDALPDYINSGVNALVIADTSGSMTWPDNGRPIATSIGLAIYFAQHNVGAYHDMFMTFSEKPQVVRLKGETLKQKVLNALTADWGMNTNLEAAFELVLKIAINNNVPSSEMPESLIVISDMEIDNASNEKWTFYDTMKGKFESYGYKIPNIVFWNVESRHNIFHADASRKGVQLCSGQSASTFRQVIDSIGLTPIEAMKKIINSERYDLIKVGNVC